MKISAYGLQGPLAQLFGQVFARAPGDRRDSQRAILLRARDERRAIDHEKVFDLVRLIEFVEYGRFRIVAHPRRADFVRGVAGRRRQGASVWNDLGACSAKILVSILKGANL